MQVHTRTGQDGAYTSDEIIPCLDMHCSSRYYDPESPLRDDDDYDYSDEEEVEVFAGSLLLQGVIDRAFVKSSGSRGGGSGSRDTRGGDRKSKSAASTAATRR